jgi:valyl-tRNA synthetase
VLDGILLLLHPFMPYVTEELWQAIPHDGETLALAAWPKAKRSTFDAEAEREVAFLQGIVVAVRNLRVESKIAPGKPVPVVVRGGKAQLDLLERLVTGEAARAHRDADAGARRVRPAGPPRRWFKALKSSTLDGLVDLDGRATSRARAEAARRSRG